MWPFWNLSSRSRRSSGFSCMAFHVARMAAGTCFPGLRRNAMRSRSFGSVKRFDAWSSKHRGVLQKSFMTAWYSGARSMPAAASSAKLEISDTLPPVGFSWRKSPKWITMGMRPKAPPTWSCSRSSAPHAALRPRKDRNTSMLYRLGEIMLTSSRIKHLTASHTPCSAFSLPPAGMPLFL